MLTGRAMVLNFRYLKHALVVFRNLTYKTANSSKCLTDKQLKNLLTTKLELPPENSTEIVDSNPNLLNFQFEQIIESLNLYSSKKISPALIRNNLFLLELKPDIVEKKWKILSSIHFNCIDHAVPFLKLSMKNLTKLVYKINLNNEAQIVPEKNRLYFLSERLKVEPLIMSHHVSQRLFVYNIQFDVLCKTLKILLDMGVSPENIVRDMRVLQYKPDVVKERLERSKAAGRTKLMPWMVKCEEKVFERSIKITTITKTLLGENKSVINYLAESLKCSNNIVYGMALKTPAISTIRVTKVKNTLDFLFCEGYTERDIIQAPRVLAHSVHTIRQRLKELRSLGVNPKNLNLVCKSKKDFTKYILHISKGNEPDTKSEDDL